MSHMNISQFNSWAKKNIVDDNKFDNDGFIIMENNNFFKSTGVISKIFLDHWDNFFSLCKNSLSKIRPNADKEVHKLIDCSLHNLGSSVFVCPNDDEVYFCHHTCKGRLCSSCGIKTQKIVTENILQKCINSKHRHITFTIPLKLTSWFFNILSSTSLLFNTS